MATAAARGRADRRELGPDWRDRLSDGLRAFSLRVAGTMLLAVAVALAVALLTHQSTDPSWSTAAGGPALNWLGLPGAYASDLLLLLLGPGGAVLLPVLGLAGVRLLGGAHPGRLGRALLVATAGAWLIGMALGLLAGSAVSGLPAGWGGVLGLGGAAGWNALLALIPEPAILAPARIALILLLALGGALLAFVALSLRPEQKAFVADKLKRSAERVPTPRRTAEPAEPRSVAPPKSRPVVAVTEPTRSLAPAVKERGKKAAATVQQQQSLALGDNYALPSHDLLALPPETGRNQIDRAGLERNARLLESVLEDFHVRGDIVEVRPGPVVTMYELEPAQHPAPDPRRHPLGSGRVRPAQERRRSAGAAGT